MEDLFTVREIRETSQRLLVARLLAAGKSYAAIEAETGASATTIGQSMCAHGNLPTMERGYLWNDSP